MQLNQGTSNLTCTLTDEELEARRQLVRKTLTPLIKSTEAGPLSLIIGFSSEAKASQIEEFVALERQCCAFLSFTIIEIEHSFELHINGPEGSETVLQMFASAAGEQKS